MAAPTGPFPAFVARRRGDDLATAVEELRPEDLPPGDVLVEVEWSGVNYKDGMVVTPGNRVSRLEVLVPGVDLAGTVVAGDDPSLPVGTAVLAHGHDIGVARHGGFATFARVPAAWAVPLPPGLDARGAMVLGTAGFTAALSVDELERRGLVPGAGPVLVTGASGGVGSVAVVLLAARGHEVVASTGKQAEHAWLRALGATEVVGRDALDDAPERVLATERWAGAVDCVGGSTLARVLRAMRYGSTVAASGLTGGSALETSVYPFITRAVALVGIDTVRTPEDRRRAVWGRLGSELALPDPEALVAREVDLTGLRGALDDILAAKVRGRILVRPTL
ncbi:MAG TPA: acryloyl-CoA reductase [Acidimicrobiales bacterium]|nr:acryloyl-CoA reductase [Acidimicrobiales bacterium]